jgi:D-glycero-beta-D-manno-heptose-7-phosphate kinase
MNSTLIENILNSFSGIKALIIGDVMVDAYLYGHVDRISPEAPVPVVALSRRVNMMGGAANVALNIASLGGVPLLFSVIGKDQKGAEFKELMQREHLSLKGIIESQERITTTKFRIIGNKNHMLRVDEEITTDLSQNLEAELLEKIRATLALQQIHVIIFQDYNKGVLTKNLIQSVIELARSRHIPVVVDPKKKNFDTYRDVTLFKPNLKELREGLKRDFASSDNAAITESIAMLQESQRLERVMVTLGEQGMVIRFKDGHGFREHSEKAHVRMISDVSGAGDTVISVAALCTALGTEAEEMTFLANLAGGIVCEYVGVVPIDKKRLQLEALSIAEKTNLQQ